MSTQPSPDLPPPSATVAVAAERRWWTFAGRYEHRTLNGGVGHNLPQQAPDEFRRAVRDVAATAGTRSHAAR